MPQGLTMPSIEIFKGNFQYLSNALVLDLTPLVFGSGLNSLGLDKGHIAVKKK
jgi:hypothetical protein